MNQNNFSEPLFSPWYFVVLMIFGTLFHFVYSFLGKPFWAGILFPTNESTFQHLKLLLLPSVVFFVLQFFLFENWDSGFMLSRFAGVLFGMLGICVFFYTYSGIVGDNFIVMDILSFAFGVVVSMVAFRLLDDSGVFDFPFSNAIGFLGFGMLIILFGLWSVYPPKIGLFFDPVTSSFDPLLLVSK